MNICLPLWRYAYRVGVNQTDALGCVFASRLCHSGQTHRFRRCSVAAVGRHAGRLSHSVTILGHHCWAGRGSIEREVCPILLHMTRSENATPDLLILSPMPYPLNHFLCVKQCLSFQLCNEFNNYE